MSREPSRRLSPGRLRGRRPQLSANSPEQAWTNSLEQTQGTQCTANAASPTNYHTFTSNGSEKLASRRICTSWPTFIAFSSLGTHPQSTTGSSKCKRDVLAVCAAVHAHGDVRTVPTMFDVKHHEEEETEWAPCNSPLHTAELRNRPTVVVLLPVKCAPTVSACEGHGAFLHLVEGTRSDREFKGPSWRAQ